MNPEKEHVYAQIPHYLLSPAAIKEIEVNDLEKIISLFDSDYERFIFSSTDELCAK